MAEPGYAEALRAFLGPSPADLAASGARALAPQLYSIMAGQPAPPPPNLPDAPGKVPSWSDKRIPSAMMEAAEGLSNFVGPGAGAKAGAAGLAAAIPIIGSRAGRAAMEVAPKPKGIVAYHGSPYDFDRFALEKIGTGEGAQAYGHGIYFAEKEGVAKPYRDSVGRGNLNVGAAPTGTTGYRNIDTELFNRYGGDLDKMITAYPSPTPKLKAAFDDIIARGGVQYEPSGKMYQVRLNAEPERFLDYDATLDKMGPAVQSGVRKLLGDQYFDRGVSHGIGGKDVYDDVAHSLLTKYNDPTLATKAFNEVGIPGNKYLDQSSRSAGEGSRNYVVFDPSIIDILKKYGLAGPVAAPALAAPLAEFLQPQPRAQ